MANTMNIENIRVSKHCVEDSIMCLRCRAPGTICDQNKSEEHYIVMYYLVPEQNIVAGMMQKHFGFLNP